MIFFSSLAAKAQNSTSLDQALSVNDLKSVDALVKADPRLIPHLANELKFRIATHNWDGAAELIDRFDPKSLIRHVGAANRTIFHAYANQSAGYDWHSEDRKPYVLAKIIEHAVDLIDIQRPANSNFVKRDNYGKNDLQGYDYPGVQTALMLAIIRSNVACMDWLKSNGANVELTDQAGLTSANYENIFADHIRHAREWKPAETAA